MIIVHVSDVTEEREEEAGMARMSPCHIHPNKSNIEGRVKKTDKHSNKSNIEGQHKNRQTKKK